MKLPSFTLRRLVVGAAAFLAAISPGALSAQVSTLTLGGTLAALQQLKSSLESTVNTVDAESAARIAQLSRSVDSAIAEVQQAIDDISNKVQVNENKVFKDVFDTMSQVNGEIEKKGYLSYIGINATLANVATTLNGVPFVNVPTYLFATYPLRMSSTAADTLVSFYGHFPDVDNDHSASVKYSVSGQAEKSSPLTRYVGGSLSFKIPHEYLKEGKFVEMTVSIPVKRFFGLYTGSTDFGARIYVEKTSAFTVKIENFQENPSLWANVPSPAEYTERADSNRTSNTGGATAQQLFSILINNTTSYVPSSATFAGMSHREDTVGAPCWCSCSGSSAAFTGWNANTVSWQLSAPSCPAHPCSKGGGFLGLPQVQMCGGGGTHAEIHLRPTFRVKQQNQPDDVSLSNEDISMKRNDVYESKVLPLQWNYASVIADFSDGDEHHKCQVNVNKIVPNANCSLFSAEFKNSKITIQTR